MPKGLSCNWIFTINNPTVADYHTLMGWEEDDRVLSVKAESEKGEKGVPLFQGAVQFSTQVSKKVACRRCGGMSWNQKAFGTWADQDYCLSDPVPIKVGSEDVTLLINFGTGWIGQGNRTDKEELVAKYPHSERRLRFHALKKASHEFRKVKLWVYFGAGGVGKDALYGLDDKHKRKPDTFMVGNSQNLKWWDGYDGESTIVISDFHGERCEYHRWLTLVDGHQCQLEVKGGHTFATWTKIILTSNVDPKDWYANQGKGFENKEYARRFHRITDVVNNKIYLAPGDSCISY